MCRVLIFPLTFMCRGLPAAYVTLQHLWQMGCSPGVQHSTLLLALACLKPHILLPRRQELQCLPCQPSHQ